MRRLHILYLHQHFARPSGSSGGRSYEFSRILQERGHRVTMVTGIYDRGGLEVPKGRLVHRMDVDSIETIAVNVPYGQRMGVGRRILSFLRFMVLATWISCRVRNVDVIFATSTPLTIAFPGILAAWTHRRPFVFEVRDLWPTIPIAMGDLRNPVLKALARLLERFAYRSARRVVALSPGTRDGVISGGADPAKVVVIPNSSDVGLLRVDPTAGKAFRVEHPEIGDRPLVVYAGAFGRVNGLEYVVRLAAAARDLDPRVAFLLLGEGSERLRVTQLADECGVLGSNLFIHDAVPRSELAPILSAATLLSSFTLPLPVIEHNSANKFFDAFGAGKPVVLNYRGWQGDLLEETGAGLVLEPRDPKGSAARLVRAITDEAWVERASAASRRLGDECFDRRRLAGELERVLMSAAAGDRGSGQQTEIVDVRRGQ